MQGSNSFSRSPIPIQAAIAFLTLALFTSATTAIYNTYTAGVRFTVSGFEITSTGWFRPVLVAALSWVALGRLVPAIRPTRDLLVVLACLVAYCLPVGAPVSGDVVPTEYTALSIASGLGSSLDSYPELVENGLPYYLAETPLGLRSSFPVGAALVAWPVYLPARFAKMPRAELADKLGQMSAILVGLACVWLAIRIAHRLSPPFSPYLLALAYGLGTSHWSTSSSALWQHGPGELWVLGGLERLLDRDTAVSRRLVAAGVCMSLAVFTRPNLIVSALIVAALALYFYRRKALAAVAGGTVVAIPLIFYHLRTYRSLLGAYELHTHGLSFKPLVEWLEVLSWLTVSPSRGMLFYEPVVLFTMAAAFMIFIRRREVHIGAGLLGFMVLLGIYGHWSPWWGGYCFGPRYMTDALPWWFVATSGGGNLGSRFKKVTLYLVAWGVLVNLIGATARPVYWDSRPSVDSYGDRLESFQDSQLVTGFLASLPGENNLRRAMEADSNGDYYLALNLWSVESNRHSWNLFAASRVADLLIRTDQLNPAVIQAQKMMKSWPEFSYVRQLHRRLPTIREMLSKEDWILPHSARASRNETMVGNVCDGSLGTHWSTVRYQTDTDWLELETDPSVPIRGVAVLSVPDFSLGPSGLSVIGRTPNGESVHLEDLPQVWVREKGWVVLRFNPRHLKSLTLKVARKLDHPWAVSEARLIPAR